MLYFHIFLDVFCKNFSYINQNCRNQINIKKINKSESELHVKDTKSLETMKVGEKKCALESLNSAWSVSAILSRKQQQTPSFEIRSLHRTLSSIITHMRSSLPYSTCFCLKKCTCQFMMSHQCFKLFPWA